MVIYFHVSLACLWLLARRAALMCPVNRALLGTLVFCSLALMMPKEVPVSNGEKMDWTGSVLGISGLVLFNFVWKYACPPHSPYNPQLQKLTQSI